GVAGRGEFDARPPFTYIAGGTWFLVCLIMLPFFGVLRWLLKLGYWCRPAMWHGRSICMQHKETVMATGTVKFFNVQKGFGFIQPTDGSKDVFVHVSAVERAGMGTLVEGQKVSYDVVTERGKPAAANLRAP